MTLYASLLLLTLSTDIVAWIVGVLLVLAFVMVLWLQRREQQLLKKELGMQAKMHKRSVELDLVLKAMKLSTWRIDARTRTMELETDSRDERTFLSHSEIPLEQVFSMLQGPEAPMLRDGIIDLLEGRRDEFNAQFQMQVPHTDRKFWNEGFAMVAEYDAEGHPLVVIGTSRRIDEQKRIEAELVEARNHAQESDRLKSAFLANMSHEIRTPLNAIVGFSDILPMVQDEAERAQLIGLIQENNRKLLHMIDDIVTMSKMDAGRAHVKKTDFDLNILLGEVAGKHRAVQQNPAVEITLHLRSDQMTIHTDRDMLTIVLNNYMQNALKFTERGQVTLGYDMESTDSVRIWVRDTGKGIPADQQDHIFEQFVKLDEFIPGTGLGLPVCRSTAQSLGGTVGVQSEVGVGSTFWIELPKE